MNEERARTTVYYSLATAVLCNVILFVADSTMDIKEAAEQGSWIAVFLGGIICCTFASVLMCIVASFHWYFEVPRLAAEQQHVLQLQERLAEQQALLDALKDSGHVAGSHCK